MQYDSYYTYTYIHLLVWYYCTSWSMICIRRAYMNYVCIILSIHCTTRTVHTSVYTPLVQCTSYTVHHV